MKKLSVLFFFLLLLIFNLSAQLETPFERSEGIETATFAETMQFYRSLAKESPKVRIEEFGTSDVGEKLELVIIGEEKLKATDPNYLRRIGKLTMLVNNGIHAGEPCGVDASMMFARELATNSKYEPLLENIVVAIVPFYNVGGALNRGCCSRANQVGPEAHGFRGNGQNLDLNRDFIKCDSRNAQAFNQLISTWRPNLFFDTHTTNGADYPYIMTLIPTQKDKIQADLGKYMEELMTPGLYEYMKSKEVLTSPYVNMVAQTPDSGITEFYDLPRYSTGYAALYNVVGYTSEAHMLKTFEQRVMGTYHLLMGAVKTLNRDRVQIARARKNADQALKTQEEFVIRYELDRESSVPYKFKGYAAKYKPSPITGRDRLWYDQNEPWEREIPFYRNYDPKITVQKPIAYIIPQSWGKAIERLQWNNVKMKPLTEDAEVEVEVYFIEDFKSVDRNGPWEGHYYHYDIEVRKETQKLSFKKGDMVVYLDQIANRYIVETLEPHAPDSYFSWNLFDPILGRKEYFSPYVFEDEAVELMNSHPEWKAEFEEAKKDSAFAANDYAMLDWWYKRSKHFEPTFRRYPVGRMVTDQKLPTSSRRGR